MVLSQAGRKPPASRESPLPEADAIRDAEAAFPWAYERRVISDDTARLVLGRVPLTQE